MEMTELLTDRGPEVPINYVREALEYQLQASEDYTRIMYEQMRTESEYVLNALESAFIVLEADNGTNTAAPAKRTMFEKIVSMLKQVMLLFVNKTDAMVERNSGWLKDNWEKLEKIDYEGLTIEMFPFWDMDDGKVKAAMDKISTSVTQVMNKGASGFKDIEAVKTGVFRDYLDENGDLVNGMKNFMRVGKAKGPLEKKTLEGNSTLKPKVVSHMRQYCLDYATKTAPILKNSAAKIEKELSMLSNSLDKRVSEEEKDKAKVAESYCAVERAHYKDTDLITCENYVVLEAGEATTDNKPAETKSADKADDKKETVNHTAVKLEDKSKNSNELQNSVNNLSTDQLTFAKNVAQLFQLTMTSTMTALEEKYVAYINVLRQVVTSRADQVKKTEKTADANVKDTTKKTNEETDDNEKKSFSLFRSKK